MRVLRALIRIIVGLAFGLLAGLAIIPALAAFSDGQGNTAWLVFAVVGLGAVLTFFAPTIRRSFGRGFLLAGVAVLGLPLSVLMLSSRVTSDMVTSTHNSGATMIGAGIGATMMTGAAGFVGFFFGAILIVIGLVLALGGRREVTVI
jgi:hypothetical protein